LDRKFYAEYGMPGRKNQILVNSPLERFFEKPCLTFGAISGDGKCLVCIFCLQVVGIRREKIV